MCRVLIVFNGLRDRDPPFFVNLGGHACVAARLSIEDVDGLPFASYCPRLYRVLAREVDMAAEFDLPSSAALRPRFTKVYDGPGWDRVEALFELEGGRLVRRLWMFLVRHCDDHNALVASRITIGEALGVSARSVSRATSFLKAAGAVDVLKAGGCYVYVLNSDEVWRGAEADKAFCSFGARVLVGFSENAGLRARLSHLLPHPELFGDAVPSSRRRRAVASPASRVALVTSSPSPF